MTQDRTEARVRLVSHDFTEADVTRLAAVLGSQRLVQGPRAEELEALVGDVAGCRHTAVCSSGTAALHLALLAAGIGPGDRVIVPASTFVATANVVELTGAACVFADSRPDDLTIDVEAVRGLLDEDAHGTIRAVIPVHMFGMPADMDGISALSSKRGLFLLEDAANALGAAYKGRPAGSLGDAAAFSFHPRKNVTTGEGGAVTVASDEALILRVKVLRSHGLVGRPPDMDVEVAGFNYRMPELSAALGVGQMERLQGILEARRHLVARYRERLAGAMGVSLQSEPADRVSSWSSFVIRVAPGSRAGVMSALRSAGVECTIAAYCVPVLSYYEAKYGGQAQRYPVASATAEGGIVVPLHQAMNVDDVDLVCDVLLAAVEEAR